METVIAVDVGGTKISGALVRYAQSPAVPTVAERRSIPTHAARGGEVVLGSLVELVAQLESLSQDRPIGIGIGTAGVVDPQTGSIRYANELMPGWTGQPVKSSIEQALELPVAVLGDVQAHALGEARWGSARAAQSCLCVGVGTGIGGAYVLDGQVLRGFRGAAGHIGHTLHYACGDDLCACGRRSHVETVASGTAIAVRYQGVSAPSELDPALMGEVVAVRASQGDLDALSVIEQAGRALGEAIGSWCNILDPELVVLSGSVTEAGPFWRGAVDDGFKAQALPALLDTPIVPAALGADAPLVGAAENLRDWLENA